MVAGGATETKGRGTACQRGEPLETHVSSLGLNILFVQRGSGEVVSKPISWS